MHPKSYVFIVTYGRTGSTLLQNLLNALPGYQIRGENNNALLSVFHAWNSLQKARVISKVGKKLPTAPSHPWYGLEETQAEPFAQEMVQSFINNVLRPDEGIRVSGFKEIRFHEAGTEFEQYLDFIHAHFPDCRFIFNTRNHENVIKSGWWPAWYAEDPDFVMDVLTLSDQYFKAYQAKYPQRGVMMHYDDYVHDRSLFRGLFDFIGEAYDPSVVDRILDHRLTHGV